MQMKSNEILINRFEVGDIPRVFRGDRCSGFTVLYPIKQYKTVKLKHAQRSLLYNLHLDSINLPEKTLRIDLSMRYNAPNGELFPNKTARAGARSTTRN